MAHSGDLVPVGSILGSWQSMLQFSSSLNIEAMLSTFKIKVQGTEEGEGGKLRVWAPTLDINLGVILEIQIR